MRVSRQLVAIGLGIGIPLLLVAPFLCFVEHHSDIHRITGATRTRTVRAGIFRSAWTVHPTWASKLIAEKGLQAELARESEWQPLSRIRRSLLLVQRGCATAPAAYSLRFLDPEEWGSSAAENSASDPAPDRDLVRWLTRFAAAPEAARRQMIQEASRF